VKIQEEILKIINEKGLSVAQIAKETGIKYNKVFSWKEGRGNPKGDEFVKMQELIEKYNERKEGIIQESSSTSDLSYLAKANADLAQANKDLSEAHIRLVGIMEKSTASASREIPQAVHEQMSDLLEIVAEIGVGTRWRSKEEAILELNRRFYGKQKA
jgi:transposase-like protein